MFVAVSLDDWERTNGADMMTDSAGLVWRFSHLEQDEFRFPIPFVELYRIDRYAVYRPAEWRGVLP